jgi:hypothetical protein
MSRIAGTTYQLADSPLDPNALTMMPTLPDCGVYLVWPTEGTDWIHPEDVATASELIPSDRVFRRTLYDGEYYRLEYGPSVIRVRPTLWLQVADEGIGIGDQVEVLSRFLENDPGIARIADVRYDKASGEIRYFVEMREIVLPRTFVVEDLKLLSQKVHLRESDFAAPRPVPSDTEPDLPIHEE